MSPFHLHRSGSTGRWPREGRVKDHGSRPTISTSGTWVSDYDEQISIEVPAGRHDVSFANIEGDWLQIRSLLLPHYRSSRYPGVDALGLASDRQLLLWFHNQESTWRTEHDGKTPAKLEAIHARVPAADGTWQVEWWKTSTGEVVRRDTATAASGELILTVPDFSSDVAVRVDLATAGTR